MGYVSLLYLLTYLLTYGVWRTYTTTNYTGWMFHDASLGIYWAVYLQFFCNKARLT